MDTAERSRITWNRLLRGAAVADLVVMAVAGLLLRDKEAVGFAGVILLGIGFLRIRHGAASIAILGILSLDVLAWMAPAATKNILSRQGVAAILVPASLATISFAGVAASMGALVRGRAPDAGGKAAPIVLQVVIGVFVVAVVASLLQTSGGTAAARDGDVVVRMRNAAFATQSIETDGPVVSFAVENTDLFWHTFTIDRPHVDVGLATRGRARRSATFTPGRYTFYCRVPGHRAAGMEGTLVVR